jgi:predicted Mrr-cat superfamily restriction endonuclease
MLSWQTSVGWLIGAVLALWGVRGGQDGAWDERTTAHRTVSRAWPELPHLTPVHARDEAVALLRAAHPENCPMRIATAVGQIFAFRTNIAVHDVVALPIRNGDMIALAQ